VHLFSSRDTCTMFKVSSASRSLSTLVMLCFLFQFTVHFILDRLYSTLKQRIETWRAKQKRLYSFLGRLRDRKGKKRLDFFEHRLERVYDLSSALQYCTKKRSSIVIRNQKTLVILA
jgi:hypothetical protein